MPNRGGWTLLELLAVMTLLAVVTGGAAFTLQAPLRAGRLRSQTDALLLAERTARSHARRFQQPVRLDYAWDEDPPALRIVRAGDESRPLVRRIDHLLAVETAGPRTAGGQTSIVIDAAGRSPTYALRFARTDGAERYLVIAGETGQPSFDWTERELDALWTQLEPPDRQP